VTKERRQRVTAIFNQFIEIGESLEQESREFQSGLVWFYLSRARNAVLRAGHRRMHDQQKRGNQIYSAIHIESELGGIRS
jgi:hypothetical protein